MPEIHQFRTDQPVSGSCVGCQAHDSRARSTTSYQSRALTYCSYIYRHQVEQITQNEGAHTAWSHLKAIMEGEQLSIKHSRGSS